MTCVLIRETQLVPSKTFQIEIFLKKIVNNLKPLTIFAESAILDIWLRYYTRPKVNHCLENMGCD